MLYSGLNETNKQYEIEQEVANLNIIANQDINKGQILEYNHLKFMMYEKKEDDSKLSIGLFFHESLDLVRISDEAKYIKAKTLIGQRAIINIKEDQEINLTLFEESELQVERDKKQKSNKNRIKAQIKNNLWL
jgi:hypothetical protein